MAVASGGAGTTGEPDVREGSAEKRAAILAAARELFVRDGADRVSMDAVSARARVSKRTVYDYFGDKQRLLAGVVEGAAASLMASLRSALDTHLAEERGITTLEELERALTGFAVEVGTTIIGSADYATVHSLVERHRAGPALLEDHSLLDAPEEALAERLARFTRAGLLDAPDARLAADHFTALTVLLAYNDQPDPALADQERVRRSMVDGVHAFVRAYAARP